MKRTICFGLLLCIAAFWGCKDNNNNNSSVGGTPSILSVSPNAVSIGQRNGEGSISGTNLNGVTSVSLGDGITVDSFNGQSATQIAFTFTVSVSTSGGQRTVTVATSGGAATNGSVFQVLNNHVPKAAFKVDPPAGSLSTVISFDASATTDQENNISSYQWDFGDGKTSQGKKVTHKYAAVGQYKPTLRVADSQQGFTLATREIQISKNSPPIARFTIKPGTSGTTSTTFIFDASKSADQEGKVKGYLWEFGDGSKARDKEVVEHQYKKEGTYFVGLTVYDNQGQASVPAEDKVKVEKGPKETVCAGNGGGHASIIRGRVVAVEAGQWAIVNFGSGHSCANTWHKCDDFRRLNPEGFYGIVDKMTDRGNGVLAVHNSCPYRWPPSVGEGVFIYFKTCSINHCP